jgi:hypothetical protein
MTEHVRLLLPVNWRNALAYYAQGLVIPREALGRYREDLLGLTPRRLPLLTGGISGSVARMCASGPDEFPVALEVGSDVSVRGEELDIGSSCAAVAPSGAIPTSHVTRIHVRSDREREEFRIRRYRNIDTEHLPVTVSQSLFGHGGVEAEPLSAWLRGLPQPAPLNQRDLIGRQCVSGALMLVLASVPPDPGVLESAGKLLENVVGRSVMPDALTALSDALAEIGWISSGDDLSICATALEILAEMSGPEPPVASEVLTRMREQVVNRNMSDKTLVMAYLDRMLAINRGDVAFTPFRRPGGLRAAKALLLFLLRPDPAAVGTWLDEDINAEAQVIALAAICAGIAHRSTGLPNELRGSEVLQHLLFDWTATGVGGPDIDIPHSTAPAVRLEHRGTDLVLTTDGKPAQRWAGVVSPLPDASKG